MDELALDAATQTLDVIATLHATGYCHPWLSFWLPDGESSTEYVAPVPPSIAWTYKAYGEFSVDATVTLSSDTRELVSVDAVMPNPALDGGF